MDYVMILLTYYDHYEPAGSVDYSLSSNNLLLKYSAGSSVTFIRPCSALGKGTQVTQGQTRIGKTAQPEPAACSQAIRMAEIQQHQLLLVHQPERERTIPRPFTKEPLGRETHTSTTIHYRPTTRARYMISTIHGSVTVHLESIQTS